MQLVLATVLDDSGLEIMDEGSPNNGFFLGLPSAIVEARKRMLGNLNIRRINIYRLVEEIPGLQGKYQLAHWVVRGA